MIPLAKPYQVSNIFTQWSPQPSKEEIDIQVEENKEIYYGVIMTVLLLRYGANKEGKINSH